MQNTPKGTVSVADTLGIAGTGGIRRPAGMGFEGFMASFNGREANTGGIVASRARRDAGAAGLALTAIIRRFPENLEGCSRRGYHTFMDDDAIHIGADICTGIQMGIKHSQSAIIMFSGNYASSAWCLDELVLILEKLRTSLFLVVPIFYYGVDPAHVRYQTEGYARALVNLERSR
ncbi:hypothetical protein RJ640_006992 [Escallonia rubra]|uniref:ADP-ribosyl cyclase/cyclic ADP-ribose hydrolase n=1 Tax=Escallonia rubra TaxID=112253 RepID=A0AA88RFC3_9ASTE|nr:hypothetical protein RJ640_006992 [Escallonia rubra]